MMCAIYRVIDCDWSKQEALDEMTKGPYGLHSVFKHIPKYFEELDIKSIKEQIWMN